MPSNTAIVAPQHWSSTCTLAAPHAPRLAPDNPVTEVSFAVQGWRAGAVMAGRPPKKSTVWTNVKPFLNGGASGMLATCVIQPIDMVKVRIQLGAHGSPVISLSHPYSWLHSHSSDRVAWMLVA